MQGIGTGIGTGTITGTIALDIDGTLTSDSKPIPLSVIKYLEGLVLKGWRLIFITGRTFTTGYRLLEPLSFPYYLAVQNGAIILEMPSRCIVTKKYLDRSIFPIMEEVCKDGPSDFVIYGGFEHDDVCYFRPKRFSAKLLKYLQERVLTFKENWRAFDNYDEMGLEKFPSIKCFGEYESAVELTNKIEERFKLHVPLIRDPFNESYYVVQATHPQISKGLALQDFIKLVSGQGKIIAAGDDYNDCSMFAVADVKIVMATAPQELLLEADIIAPPASEEGIIIGLEAALKW